MLTHRNIVLEGVRILQHTPCSAAGQWHYPLPEPVQESTTFEAENKESGIFTSDMLHILWPSPGF